jgi:Mce-associated membrane protein
MSTPSSQPTATELELPMPVDTDDETRPPPGGADVDPAEQMDVADDAEPPDAKARRIIRFSWKHVLAHGMLPGLALILAVGAGYLKWQDTSARLARTAATQSVQVAIDSSIAMLSYKPDTADKDLNAARDRLTGQFKDDYTGLINEVVIPGAKQKQITARATVPAAAVVSATDNHAIVLVFVDQTINFGDDPPTDAASSVRVTLDKVHNRWLISQFDPV